MAFRNGKICTISQDNFDPNNGNVQNLDKDCDGVVSFDPAEGGQKPLGNGAKGQVIKFIGEVKDFQYMVNLEIGCDCNMLPSTYSIWKIDEQKHVIED